MASIARGSTSDEAAGQPGPLERLRDRLRPPATDAWATWWKAHQPTCSQCSAGPDSAICPEAWAKFQELSRPPAADPPKPRPIREGLAWLWDQIAAPFRLASWTVTACVLCLAGLVVAAIIAAASLWRNRQE